MILNFDETTEGTQLRTALDTKDQIIRTYEEATEGIRDCQKLRD
jgi:hypothetical protein